MRSLCCAGLNNPYYIISRARDQSKLDDFVRVYKSPPVMNNTNPIFNPQRINLAALCNGDKELPIKFEIYSYHEDGNDKLYGSCTTSVYEMQ